MNQADVSRTLFGDNPFNVLPEHDLLHNVRNDLPYWSETQFFQTWSPTSGTGVFVHVGRWPGDLDLWWAQVVVMLPDGKLLVDRSWGRAVDDRGPATGNLRVECIEPLKGWRLRFDGAGEPTTLARMAESPVGAGGARAFSFDVELAAVAPVWDMHGALGSANPDWAACHHTQGLRAQGFLRAEGVGDFSLEGIACRDHSSGPRRLENLGGLHFFVAVFPDVGRVLNGLVNWQRDGQVAHRVFTVQQNGRCEIGSDVRMTGLADLATHQPRDIVVHLGGEASYRAEWLHGYTLSLLDANLNVNGLADVEDADLLAITQGVFRFVADDGEVGWGVIERDYRRAMLPSPQER